MDTDFKPDGTKICGRRKKLAYLEIRVKTCPDHAVSYQFLDISHRATCFARCGLLMLRTARASLWLRPVHACATTFAFVLFHKLRMSFCF